MRSCLVRALLGLVGVFVVLGLVITVNRARNTGEAAPPAVAVYGTLIGYTETTGHRVTTVDLKDVPSGRVPFHTVATLPEGTRVQILQHDANDALVLAPDGSQGYVSVDAVRELCGASCPE